MYNKANLQFIETFPPGGRWPEGPDEGQLHGFLPPHQSKIKDF